MGNNRSVLKSILRFTTKATLLLLMLTSSAYASDNSLEGPSDWPMYQLNPQHTGYNDKDSITIPLNLLWTKKITPVDAFVEPATVIGNFMIVSNEESDPVSDPPMYPTIWKLDINTGDIIWKKQFEINEIDYFDQACYYKNKFYIREQPNYAKDIRIAQYEFETGKLLARFLFDAQFNDQLGSIVYNDKLLFPAGLYNGIYCADIVLDEYLWGGFLPQIDHWSPAAYDTVVYSWCKTLLSAHHLTTGDYLWYIAPDYYDTALFYNQSNNLDSIFNLYDQHSILTKTQQYPLFDWSGMNTATVVDTVTKMIYCYYLFGFHAVNYESRIKAWEKDFDYKAIRPIISTPSTCQGKVYSIFLDTLIALDGFTGDELWRYELDTLTGFPTVIANGLLFASTENKTIAFNIATQNIVWEYPVGGFLSIAQNKLFVVSIKGEIFVFGQITTDIEESISPILPSEFELHQNYPNPFNPTTTINFVIPKRSEVFLRVFNLLGKEVITLIDKSLPAGSHSVLWDGKDRSDEPVASGVYLYSLVTNHISIAKKMTLIK